MKVLYRPPLYWIGEAQNDFDYDSAFLKYWISLETIFSIFDENITASIAKGISTLVPVTKIRRERIIIGAF